MVTTPGQLAELGGVLLAASSTLRCINCGVEEYVIPLDDQPIDEAFSKNYFCNDCEVLEA